MTYISNILRHPRAVSNPSRPNSHMFRVDPHIQNLVVRQSIQPLLRTLQTYATPLPLHWLGLSAFGRSKPAKRWRIDGVSCIVHGLFLKCHGSFLGLFRSHLCFSDFKKDCFMLLGTYLVSSFRFKGFQIIIINILQPRVTRCNAERVYHIVFMLILGYCNLVYIS